MSLEQYYRVLGLEPGASLAEVNQAYKDLAFIWHPDRVPKDNQRLLQKAQEKLKEINQARDQLRSIQANADKKAPPPRSPSAASPRYKKPPEPHYQPPSQSYYQSASQSHYQSSSQSHYQSPSQSHYQPRQKSA